MTKRIQLLVTGDMEAIALGDSLQKSFAVTRNGEPIEFLRPKKMDSITGNHLPPNDISQLPEFVRLAGKHVVAAVLDQTRPRADLVVCIDDLEVANADQPEVVVGWVRRAVQTAWTERWEGEAVPAPMAERLARSCSFHLFSPMTEAYFFADVDALSKAGVDADHPPTLRDTRFEDFFVTNEGYLASNDALSGHPKQYLRYLVEQSAGATIYRETHEGAAALRRLDWSRVATSGVGLTFASSLFLDLSDALDAPNPFEGTAAAPETSTSSGCLRNI